MHYTSIRIEKGIPMPTVTTRGLEGSSKVKYPWRKMEIGDSFLFPTEIQRQSYAAATQASRLTGFRFAVRRTDAGYRCWRVA